MTKRLADGLVEVRRGNGGGSMRIDGLPKSAGGNQWVEEAVGWGRREPGEEPAG